MESPSVEEQRQFYDGFWAERSRQRNAWEVQRLARVLDGIASHTKLRGSQHAICDLGCGTGWMSNELRKFGQVDGIDFSEEGLRIACQEYPEVTFEQCDVLAYRPKKHYDLVVSSEVVEHIPDKAAYFETVDAILKPGGYLVLTCPNGDVRRFYGRTPGQIIEEWPTKNDLVALATRHMNVVYSDTFVHNFSNHGIFRVLNSAKLNKVIEFAGLRRLYLSARSALGLGLFHVMVCRKPE